MSKAYKCDRCGDYVDDKQTVGKVRSNQLLSKTTVKDSADLCESCEGDFDEFLANDLTESCGVPSLATQSVELEFESTPRYESIAFYWDSVSSGLTKNYFGDAEHAQGALDDQIEGGYRNY